MLDLLHGLGAGLETLLETVSGNAWLAFALVFLVAIGEAVFILGLFVPSTPVLLLAGGLIADGRLPFWEIYLGAVAGAAIGDAISYTIGHWLKDRIKTAWPFRHHAGLIARGEAYFARHGGASVFIGRFIPAVKAVVPGIAGMFGMDYRAFTLINVTSAFAWAAAHILPGMLLSAWFRAMGLSLEVTLVAAAALLGALLLLAHHWRRLAARIGLRLPPPGTR